MLVYTIKELCRTCYTCVRECPARAIRIVGGQAEVITERCVACGNCTKVCSQGAKVFVNTVDLVNKVLERPGEKAALLAPSFPAEFGDVTDYRKVVGMIRALGFRCRSCGSPLPQPHQRSRRQELCLFRLSGHRLIHQVLPP